MNKLEQDLREDYGESEPTNAEIQARHDEEQADETNRLQKGRAYRKAHKDRGILLTRNKELEATITASAGLSCPNCENDGCIPEQDGRGEWYPTQCEFCYVVEDSVFNRKALLDNQSGDKGE